MAESAFIDKALYFILNNLH